MVKRHKTAAHKVSSKAVYKVKKHLKSKTVKIKHHHAKPYRKRHVSALFVFIILSSALITWLVIYREQVRQSISSANNFISDTFNPSVVTKQSVSSTYGYSLLYDVRTFSGSAIDTATGDLFVGQELGTNRAYETVKIATGSSDISKNSQRSLTLSFYDQPVSGLEDGNLSNLETSAAKAGIDTAKATITSTASSLVTLGDIPFRAMEWQVQSKADGVASKVQVEFRTYAGVVNGRAMVIKLTYGLSTGKSRDIFNPILESLKFGARKQAAIVPSKQVAEKIQANRSLLDTLLFTHLASAAATTADNSEQISSRYSPAVVKVYNVYCMDINIDSKLYLSNVCEGGTGSGFFIDSEGNVATNGHVASADPLDIIIQDAVAYLSAGDQTYFNILVNLAGVKASDFKGDETDLQIIEIAVDKMYAIDPSRVVAVNNVTNMLVGLNEKQPDLAELVKDTKNRQTYAEQESVVKAKLVAKDYRVIDGITSFKASDVAIIKLDTGSDYPVTKLGSINGVSQGAALMILGYPGEASDNGLVDGTVSKPTLTAGKVSSIKTVTGSSKKLIETDATIGHGNSGGPVFDNTGNVIGIATYTIDGSGNGNGVYNYIRDIQDLKDLASTNSVTVNGTSQTQTEWDKGIDLFYKAHYSKAVKSFTKVKALYPQHPKADELIAAANERIKNGEDVKDFPYILVAVAVVSVAGVAVSAFLIVRHRKIHKVYTAQVANGGMQPMAPGSQPQTVSYNPNGYSPASLETQPSMPPTPTTTAPSVPTQSTTGLQQPVVIGPSIPAQPAVAPQPPTTNIPIQ